MRNTPFSWMHDRLRIDRPGLLALLLALALVRGLIYAAVIPLWQAPDEPYHFATALLPNLPADPEAADSQWRTLQIEMLASMLQHRFWDFQVFEPVPQTAADRQRLFESVTSAPRPPAPRAFTYYGLAYGLRPVAHQDVTFQLYWARLLSVLTNLGLVSLAFAVGCLLFDEDPATRRRRGARAPRWDDGLFGAALLPIAVVFHPQNTFITAGVNDGNPATLLASVAVVCLVLIIVRGFRWYYVLAMGAFAGLAVAAKLTAVFLLPLFLIVAGLYVWKRLPGWWRLVVVVVAAGAGFSLLQFSPRLMAALTELQRVLVADGVTGFVVSLADAPFQRGFFWAFRSFWAFLGWESLPVGDEWVWSLLGLCGLAALGWVRLAVRHAQSRGEGHGDTARWRAWLAFLMCVVSVLLLIALQSIVRDVEMYVGRYLFAVIIPIMASLVIGWREVVPLRWRGESLAVLTSLFVVFDAAVLLDYALPFFYPLWR